MGLISQVLLIFDALLVASHCLPDEPTTLLDASVFELPPPKEFLDLFKPDDSKKLNNPMKSPLAVALRNNNVDELAKILPDPSVFELTPPKEFSDLFRLKENKNSSVIQSNVAVGPIKEPSKVDIVSEPATEQSQPVLDENKTQENAGLSPLRDTAEITPSKEIKSDSTKKLNDPAKPPFMAAIRSENLEEMLKLLPDASVFEMTPPKEFLDLFKPKEQPSQMKEPSEATSMPDKTKEYKVPILDEKKPEKSTELSQAKDKPQVTPPKGVMDLSKLDDSKQLDNPMNFPWIDALRSQNQAEMLKYLPDPSVFEMEPPKEFLDLFRLKEKEKDVTVRPGNHVGDNTSDEKTILQESKTKNPIPPPEEKDLKTNKNIDKKEELSHKDTEEVKPADVVKLEDKTPPILSVPDNSALVPGKLEPIIRNQHYEFGNMAYVSTRNPPQNYGFLDIQKPNQAYSFVYTNQPNQQTHKPKSKDAKPEKEGGIDAERELIQTEPNFRPNSIPEYINQGNSAYQQNGGNPGRPEYGYPGNMISERPNYSYHHQGHHFRPMNQGIPTRPPNSGYQPYIPNYVGQRQPLFVNPPYGSNGAPLNYVLLNAPQTNGPIYTQTYPPNSGPAVMAPSSMNGGYNQNGLYALVPISNNYRPGRNPYVSQA